MKTNRLFNASACCLMFAVTVSSPASEPAKDKKSKSSCEKGVTAPADFDKEKAAKESRAAVDRFLKEWNTGKIENLRKTLHYPFITVGYEGKMHVAKTPEEFKIEFDRFRTNQNWDHSTFDKIEPIFVSEDKAHYKVAWSRHNTAGRRYMAGEIVYIVTKKEGRWAFAVRSTIWHKRNRATK